MSAVCVAFVGLTHLGLNSAVAAAERGNTIVAFDPDGRTIERIKAFDLPYIEPDLEQLYRKNSDQITVTSDPAALSGCDVVYVAPDVKTDDKGTSDLTDLEALLHTAFEAADETATIVVLSQVPPGFTRVHQRSGRVLIYQVETLIFGRAIERALFPERTIIGQADPSVPLPEAYLSFLKSHGDPPLIRMLYESAELAKIAINCFLVSSISTTNTLAELCEVLGADWSEIVPALRLDRRIGEFAYLSPGLGIAGGNLERDLATVCRIADAQGTDAQVVRSWTANSVYRRDWVLRQIGRIIEADPSVRLTIAILGLAYKENTNSTKNSPSLALIEALRVHSVRIYDPVVDAAVVKCETVEGAEDAVVCMKGADLLVIMTPWPEFRDLSPDTICNVMRGRIVIDPYNVLDADACRTSGLQHIMLGRRSEPITDG